MVVDRKDPPEAGTDAGAQPAFDWIAVAVVVAALLGFFWRVLLLGEVILPLDVVVGFVEPWRSESSLARSDPVWNPHAGDAVTQDYPEAVASARAWRDGVPLWNPLVLTGMPALATGRSWSNPVIVVLGQLLPAERALTLATVIHLLIGAVSCLLLLGELGCGRVGRLVGTLIFTFNPYLVGWYSHHSLIGGWVWIPLVFFGFEAARRRSDRRWLLLGGAALALQVVGGFFLWPFYTCATLALYAISLAVADAVAGRSLRRVAPPVLDAAGIGLVGLGLSAPLWLLTAELFQRTARVEDFFAGLSLPLAQAARLLVPDLWGRALHGEPYSGFFNPVETNLSVGAVGLLLAAAALAARGRRRPLIITALGVFALLAIFGIEPLRALMDLVNPTFSKTFPGRAFYVAAFGLSLAAAIGADWLERERPPRLLRGLAATSLAAAACLLAGAAVVQLRGLPTRLAGLGLPSCPLDLGAAPGRGVVLAAGVLAAAAAALWAWSAGQRRQWPGAALVGIVAVELFGLGIGVTPSFPSAMTFPEQPSLAALVELSKASDQPVRTACLPTHTILPGQMPMIWGLQVPTGYSSWLLRRYAEYSRLLPGRTGGEIEVYLADCDHPLIDALNPVFVYAPASYRLPGAGAIGLDQRLEAAQVSTRYPGGVAAVNQRVEDRERPALLTTAPSTVTFRLTVPEGARLRTAVALDPAAWEHSDGMVFKVLVAGPDAAEPSLRFKTFVGPGRRPGDRRPRPVEVDLSDLAGSTVALTLVAGPGPAGDDRCDWGAWIEPTLERSGPPDFELLVDGPNRVYRNPRALPRAWLVHEVAEVAPGDLEAAGRVLGQPGFRPASQAVVEGRVGVPLGVRRPDDGVRVSSYVAERVELEVRTAEAALLVLSDMVYPGWRATVDGVERPILATNLIMRGVVVGPDDRHIVFEYCPRWLAVGLVSGVCTALVCVAGLIVATRRRRARSVQEVGRRGMISEVYYPIMPRIRRF